MTTLLRDLASGVTFLRQKPWLTLTILLTLALGIGANSVLYSILETVFLQPLPFRDADKLTLLFEDPPQWAVPGQMAPFRDRDYLAFKEQSRSYEAIGAYVQRDFDLSAGGKPEQAHARLITSEYLTVLGLKIAWGRPFLKEEFSSGNEHVVIVSHEFWKNRLGGQSDAIGQAVRLDGTPYTVVGIMPSSFRLPTVEGPPPGLWAPLVLVHSPDDPDTPLLHVVARLKPEVNLPRAREEAQAISEALGKLSPHPGGVWKIRVENMQRYYAEGIKSPLNYFLMLAVSFVLLIACCNVANLLMARGVERNREMAIRSALGATPWRLLRQLILENLVLYCLGGLIGTAGSAVALRWIGRLLVQNNLPVFDFQLDWRVVTATMVLTLGCGVIFGLLPARQAARVDLNWTLKEGGQGLSAGRRRRRTSQMLVMAELATSLILLALASLSIKSMAKIWQFGWGINVDKLLALQVTLPAQSYPSGMERLAYCRQVIQELKTLPGVQEVGFSDRPLIGFGFRFEGFQIVGRPPLEKDAPSPMASVRLANADYFKVSGSRLVQGRWLSSAECDTGMKLAVINETMAKRFWKEESPVGAEVELGGTIYAIVGVILNQLDRHPMMRPQPEIVLPYAVNCPASLGLTIQSSSAAHSLLRPVRQIVERIQAEVPAYSLQPMEQVQSEFMILPAFVVGLFCAMAGIAALLAAAGLFGILSFYVSERRREIGIRMAMGASRADILRSTIWRGMTLIISGILLGLPVAWVLSRIIVAQIYWLKVDPLPAIVLVTAFMLLSSMLACYLPARRAASVNVITALRYE